MKKVLNEENFLLLILVTFTLMNCFLYVTNDSFFPPSLLLCMATVILLKRESRLDEIFLSGLLVAVVLIALYFIHLAQVDRTWPSIIQNV